MKIAWVTPFSTRSAIGRVSSAVVRELLARHHEVLIIRSERDKNDAMPTYPSSVPVTWWHDISPHDLELRNDGIVLNFGDNYEFHAGTLAFAESERCVGIFHDFYLYNMFYCSLICNGLDESVHEREVSLTYGANATPLAAEAWRKNVSIEQIADVLPMTEWLGRRCGAALAHSRFYSHRLENSCPGPVAIAPLCFEARDIDPLPKRSTGHVTITTVGVINPNKCIDRLITAIGASPMLRASCRLRVVGAITDNERRRLHAVSRDAGFDQVAVLGEVDDATLTDELERADILSCLRCPVLEGASASAIEGMRSGRPIIVADAGFYSDLPDELVFKVPSSVDMLPLGDLLERLVSNEKLRQEIGCKARDWASRTFTTESYVTILEDLMTQFVNSKPLFAVANRIGRQLASLGIGSDDLAIQRLSKKMNDLFNSNT